MNTMTSESFRLLTEYHSFLPKLINLQNHKIYFVSVSLRSIIHSYKEKIMKSINVTTGMFPSPYGVSFIHSYYFFYFILIVLFCQWVSVSLRSYIHSYQMFIKFLQGLVIHSFRLLTELYSFLHQDYDCIYYEGPFQVSVSLRSYIHSY